MDLRGRIWILANPTAGRGRGNAVAAAVASRLRGNGCDVEVETRVPEAAGYDGRPDAVVVVGGDGTLRAAVERLVSLYGENAPPVLPVPMGTANLMGQYLGRPRSLLEIGLEGVRGLADQFDALPAVAGLVRRVLPDAAAPAERAADDALASLERGETCEVDLCEADGRLFLLMAGVGFDAHVVHALDARRTGPIGLLSYALPAAAAVAAFGFPPVRVEVDGRRIFGPKPAVVMLANVPQYGTGFPLVPHARPDDGRLDVLCLPAGSREELLKLFALAATGGHLSAPGVARAAGRRVRVTADAPVPVQLDGDPGGTLPLDARLLDQKIRLVRPAGRAQTAGNRP